MSREAEPKQTLGLFRRASAGGGRSLSFARVEHGLFLRQCELKKLN